MEEESPYFQPPLRRRNHLISNLLSGRGITLFSTSSAEMESPYFQLPQWRRSHLISNLLSERGIILFPTSSAVEESLLFPTSCVGKGALYFQPPKQGREPLIQPHSDYGSLSMITTTCIIYILQPVLVPILERPFLTQPLLEQPNLEPINPRHDQS